MKLTILSITAAAILLITGCEEGGGDEPAPDSGEAAEAAGGAAAVPADAAGEAKAELPAWRFLKVQGEVKKNGDAAAVDHEIGATDTIETGADGYAVITLGPKSVIEVRSNTRFTLGKSERKKISAKLEVGILWSFFAGPSDFEVVTGNATAGVRGTIFFVDASQKETHVVCACDHTVHVEELGAKKTSGIDYTGVDGLHTAYSFTRKKKKVKRKLVGKARNPPNHPDELSAELLGMMPE